MRVQGARRLLAVSGLPSGAALKRRVVRKSEALSRAGVPRRSGGTKSGSYRELEELEIPVVRRTTHKSFPAVYVR